jgi:drug/metabolite transporter (DMT)-like permease
VLEPTLLALGAAVLHAAWNLSVHQRGDRFVALWGQFAVAGLGCVTALAVLGGLPVRAALFALTSATVHVPYCWFLARAYDRSEFSLVYPIARGGGAALAAVGGIVLLGDHVRPLGVVAIAVIVVGLLMLGGRSRFTDVENALAVALTIGAYSVIDAHASRATSAERYGLALFSCTMLTITTFGLLTGKRVAMRDGMRANWRRYALAGAATTLTYGMVLVAYRSAPVGYVNALRESSVLIVAVIGWRVLHERAGRRRVLAAATVVGGLVTLIVSH